MLNETRCGGLCVQLIADVLQSSACFLPTHQLCLQILGLQVKAVKTQPPTGACRLCMSFTPHQVSTNLGLLSVM